VGLEQADAQTHRLPDSSFDIAISRFSTMFFADAGAAFANLAPALRPGDRLYIATWQPLELNDWLAIPGAALLNYGSLPETTGPGMFLPVRPAVLTATISGAGSTTVDVTPIAVDLGLGADPADATDYLADTGIGRAVLDTVPEPDEPAALDAVPTTLTEHQTPRGVELGAAILITTATRSSLDA
jgi:hypothetical protein